jgi:hypothetical protein
MSFDGAVIYHTDQNLRNGNFDNNFEQNSLLEAENKFLHFIKEIQVRNTFIYREQLKSNA